MRRYGGGVDLEQLTGPVAYHGEGPVWSTSWGGLHWVDMLAGDVLSLAADGSVGRRHVSDIVAAMRPRTGGGTVYAVERGLLVEDDDGTLRQVPVWRDPAVRMNEGACDPDGRLWVGSMAYAKTPGAASLYRWDGVGEVEPVLHDVTISNGMGWSPDGTLAYYNDTATHEVSVFDYARETGLTNRRTLVRVADDGSPDGLTVDAEGGIWTAIANQGTVHRYTPQGRLDEVIEVPATKVTSCTFGGEELDRLFITTSKEDVDTSADRNAGSLFCADVGVRGLPVLEFAG